MASERWGVSAQPLGRRAESLRMRLGASSTSRPPPRSRSRWEAISVDPMGWWVVETADRLPRSSFVPPPTAPPPHGLFAHAVYCEACEFWLNGQEQFADHLLGKKAQKRIAQTSSRRSFVSSNLQRCRPDGTSGAATELHSRVCQEGLLARDPALKITKFAKKATLHAEFRSEMAAAVVALAVTSHRGKKVAASLAYWSGGIPHFLHQMQV